MIQRKKGQLSMGKKIIDINEVKKLIDEFTGKNKELLNTVDFVVGVSRGGLVPAALLAAKIDKPLIAAYIDKKDKIFFDRADWIKGKQILVVDDIIRSGKTLWLLKNHLEKNFQPAKILFYTLFNVVSLKNRAYGMSAMSRKINEDVIFPWDNREYLTKKHG